MKQLTQARLRELHEYDTDTGLFRRLSYPKSSPWHGRIGTWGHRPDGRGYINIGIDGKVYTAHRLAWLYVFGRWPKHQIDHINGNRADNRLLNLREATNAQNNANKGPQSNNKSGLKGAYYDKSRGLWFSTIRHGGRTTALGRFETAIEAHRAYVAAAERLHGSFARAS